MSVHSEMVHKRIADHMLHEYAGLPIDNRSNIVGSRSVISSYCHVTFSWRYGSEDDVISVINAIGDIPAMVEELVLWRRKYGKVDAGEVKEIKGMAEKVRTEAAPSGALCNR